jgi:hypothetical protein
MLDKVYGKVEMKIEVYKWHECFMMTMLGSVNDDLRCLTTVNFCKWQKGRVHAHYCAK